MGPARLMRAVTAVSGVLNSERSGRSGGPAFFGGSARIRPPPARIMRPMIQLGSVRVISATPVVGIPGITKESLGVALELTRRLPPGLGRNQPAAYGKRPRMRSRESDVW